MRTIKFRAWNYDILKGVWRMYEWDEVKSNCMAFFTNPERFTFFKPIKKPHVIMQFTGLTDKNGKEIYEGDIVKHFDHDGIIREIIFMKGSSGYWTGDEFISYASNYHFEWKDLHKSDNIEIIGNIHENPKLLK